MKAAITCKNLTDVDFIYDLLTTPNSGCEVLSGAKTCLDEHLMVDDIIEFDLTAKEMDALSKYPQVISVNVNDNKFELHYNKIGQNGIPRMATYNHTFTQPDNINKQISHSLLYCQTSDLLYSNDNKTNNILSLSSIDCSNVDIIVLDTGIDKTHPELFDQYGEQQTVEFDWTLLREGDPETGMQIVTYQSSQYYSDPAGHGTACASLVAGKKNGFAKNAKIYSLRSNELGSTTNGFYLETCLKLALAFQKAKKLNLYNLQSNRPTIFTNSWGIVGPKIADDLEFADTNTSNFHSTFGGGKNTLSYNVLPGNNTIIDAYFRQILLEGIHVTVSAGNINAYLTTSSSDYIDVHCFRRTESSTTYDYVTVKTEANKTKYTQNVTYGYNYKYGSTQGVLSSRKFHCYQSPNIGLDQNPSNFPLIVVGDTIPIKSDELDSNIYWTSGSAKSTYQILTAIPISENRIINNETTCYSTLQGPFFVKSAYSSFGPAVDIYAPGNGTWAAMSNQVASTTSPLISTSLNERYYFFNGTSAACPIVAGALATILAQHPNLTPLEAKNTLMAIGLKGGIMETLSSTLSISSCGDTGYNVNCFLGAELNNMSTNSNYRIQNGGSSYFRTGNLEDMLFCSRFFNSNNVFCQAYPLREAILRTNNQQVTLGLSTLNYEQETNLKPTHSI